MKSVRNPRAGTFVLPDGYRDIGYQFSGEHPDIKRCREIGHTMKDGQITEFDNSTYLFRCTDVVQLCSACRIAQHLDMSD